MKRLETIQQDRGASLASQQRKHQLQWLLKLLLSILLLGLVLRSVEPALFWKTIRSADMLLVAVAVILFFPGQLLAAYRWYFLLKRLDLSQPFWSIVRYTILGQLSALFLPGRISGDVVRTIAIAHGQREKAPFALSVIIDKAALLIAVSTFALVGVFGTRVISQFSTVYVAALGLILVAFVLLVFLCRFRNNHIPDWLGRLGRRLPFGHRYVLNVGSIPRVSFHTIVMLLVLGFGLQLSYTIGSYVMARSMHISINPIDWAAITAIVSLVQILPVTIGGLGVREGVLAGILALYRVPGTQAVALSLTAFAIVSCLIMLSWLIIESASMQKVWNAIDDEGRLAR
jgi:uncharacterized protein (TIRG00374 family)